MRCGRGIVRGNMISRLIESVYGGGVDAARTDRVSNTRGIAAPEAIHWRRLIGIFIRFIFSLARRRRRGTAIADYSIFRGDFERLFGLRFAIPLGLWCARLGRLRVSGLRTRVSWRLSSPAGKALRAMRPRDLRAEGRS